MTRILFFVVCLGLAVILWLEYANVSDDKVERTIRERSEQLGDEAARVVQEARQGLRKAVGELHQDTSELREGASDAQRQTGEAVQDGAGELRDETSSTRKHMDELAEKARGFASKAAAEVKQRAGELRAEYEKRKQRDAQDDRSSDKQ
jgi:hypothetical protein